MRILRLKFIGVFGETPTEGYGTLAAAAATTSGSGTRTVNGTSGSLSCTIATASGSGTRTINVTDGTMAAAAASTSGTGIVVAIKGTGTLTAAIAETSGTGSRGSTGTGDLDCAIAETSGTGNREITGTGDLDCAIASTSGIGEVGNVVSGAGTLDCTTAELSGTGEREITSSGTLTAAIASVLGTGDRIITSSVTLSANITSTSGTGTRGSTGTGDLDANVATTSGSGSISGIPIGSVTIYITPNGNDSNDGSTELLAIKTFDRAKALMSAGYELVLLNGVYTEANNGSLNEYDWDGSPLANGGQPISGISAEFPTVYKAKNWGSVSVEGSCRFGNTFDHVSHIWCVGITFHNGCSVYSGDYCTIKHCGVEGFMGCGTNDHDDGNQYNLYEDCWVWSNEERISLSNYRASNNTYRRIVIMDNGCTDSNCNEGGGNYSVGSTVYNSSDVILENVIVVDRDLRNAQGYADFATAQHTTGSAAQSSGELNGRNEWLGCVSVNSNDDFVNFEADYVEPDGATTPTATLTDCVGLETGWIGWDGANRPPGGTSPGGESSGYSYFTVDNLRSYGSDADIYVGCDVSSGGDPAVDNTPTCGIVHDITDLDTDTYANRPNNLVPQVRYGTSDALWPWPNESRMKTEMSYVDGILSTRDWTAGGLTFSEYINSYDAGSGIINATDATLAAAVATTSGTGNLDRTIIATPQSYTLGGTDVDLAFGYYVTADSQTYTLAGQDVTFELGYAVEATSQTYSLVGQDVAFEVDYAVEAVSQTYTLAGQDVDLESGVFGSGDLTAEIAEVTGTGTRGSTGTGDLDANVSTITGTGARGITGSGTPTAQTAEISGNGQVAGIISGSGNVTAQTATIIGAGERIITGTGAVEANIITISGIGTKGATGSGSLDSITATIDGNGQVANVISGAGNVVAQTATIVGVGSVIGIQIITGTGALEANITTIYAEEYIPFRRRLTMNSNNRLTLYR